MSVGGLVSKSFSITRVGGKIKAMSDFCFCIRRVSLFPASEVTKFQRRI